ncbi:uncharacterized protein LOC124461684, partial [Drosophila willistoni]|uniref:uncharacterized protein LOC124461684 n=1 Tax=Drosophila willistoni TaxID=7260 RepID=UPI001F083793
MDSNSLDGSGTPNSIVFCELMGCQEKSDLDRIKSAIMAPFECVDKGPVRLFLGMEVHRDGELGEISLGHLQYIKDLLERYGYAQCRQLQHLGFKIHYKQSDAAFTGFVDADWAGDRIDRKSYTGYVYFLAGGPISWKSEKQRSVALSSTEAEYMALSTACKEAIVLRRLIIEIGCGEEDTSTVLYGDNLSAQQLAKNP